MPSSFFGEPGPTLESGGVLLARARHEGRLKTPRHSHDALCIHYVLSGLYCERTPGATHHLGPGRLLFKPPGEKHSNTFDYDGSVTIRIEADAGAVPAFASLLPPRAVATREPALVGVATRLGRELWMPDRLSEPLVAALLVELLAGLARLDDARTRGRVLTRRCRRLIETRFADRLGLADAASHLGVHPSHLARVFRRDMGCTVGDYLERVRLRWVAGELPRHRGGLAALAVEAGFADQSHLTRAFRRVYGEPPGRWLAAQRLHGNSRSS